MAKIGFVVVFMILSCFVGCCYGANILYLNNVASPSHFIWNRALMYGLAAKGHNLTVLSIDVEENAPENIHYIHIEKIYDSFYNNTDLDFDFIEMGKANVFYMMYMFEYYPVTCCGFAVKTKGFETLKNYPDDFKFDLVINDYLGGPCLLVFMHKFNYPPLIQATAFDSPALAAHLTGALVYPGFVVNHELDASPNMCLCSRIKNFIVTMFGVLMKPLYLLPNVDKIVRNIFPGTPYVQDFNELTKLVLVNSNPVLDQPEPILPNVIPVGGMQIPKTKPLPDDVKKVIEGAKTGAILFSLGTNVRSDSLGKDRIIKILTAMEKLPQYQFLWKFESDTLPIALPKNVYLRAWMPQSDILAQPNVKLFISHSGLLSTQEAVYHGVPVIGFPVFADQFKNINKLVSLGVGKRLSIIDFESKHIVDAVEEIMNDQSFAENMRKVSIIFKDQPQTPLDRAVWWSEWVMRNPDSEVMISNSLKMGIMERHSFDVLIVLLSIFTICLHLIAYLVYRLLKKCSNSVEKPKKD